jgi:hypothetical protein
MNEHTKSMKHANLVIFHANLSTVNMIIEHMKKIIYIS